MILGKFILFPWRIYCTHILVSTPKATYVPVIALPKRLRLWRNLIEQES